MLQHLLGETECPAFHCNFMDFIVGNTGFVGSNLCASHSFDGQFHSTDIANAYGASPDLLVYAGLRAEKYLANRFPEQDMDSVRQAFDNIMKIAPKRLVLISTVDVYPDPKNVDENTVIRTDRLLPYGLNRLRLEEMVRDSGMDALIVRLPGLYGQNLKKNFIYDMINLIPFMLNADRFDELCADNPSLKAHYDLQPNGFYRLNELTVPERMTLRSYFSECGFSALNFTDCRSVFQMYPLRMLWGHIEQALSHGIDLLNISVQPTSAEEIYRSVHGSDFENRLDAAPADYCMKTVHSGLLGGSDGFLLGKEQVLSDISGFVLRQINALSCSTEVLQ